MPARAHAVTGEVAHEVHAGRRKDEAQEEHGVRKVVIARVAGLGHEQVARAPAEREREEDEGGRGFTQVHAGRRRPPRAYGPNAIISCPRQRRPPRCPKHARRAAYAAKKAPIAKDQKMST